MEIEPIGSLSGLAPSGGAGETSSEDGPGFMEMLGRAIEEVNASQRHADSLITRVLAGEDVPTHEAILAVEQANLTLQMALQIRNHLLEAYQEISRTQI